MAKLHSKKKGKSGTKRPKRKIAPAWIAIKPEEVKDLIREMAKKGVQPSSIGRNLRDQYGVPSVRSLIGMRIEEFLRQEQLIGQYPEDLFTLIKRAVRLREHLKTAKGDIHNTVKLRHIESKILRLVKYYRRVGKLPSDWRYEPETASLLVK